ncbi:MAG TPA: GGDEF domain-containing protein [Devosia sp.]|nr:GGDEF domain-containing protein [Devosia sp.]
MSTVVAIAFGILAFRSPSLWYLRHFSLGFLAMGAGVFVQVAWLPPGEEANSIVATTLYLASALLFAEGVQSRAGDTMGRIFHVVTFTALMLATLWFLFVSPDVVARTYILNFGFGGIVLCGALRRARRLLQGSVAEKFLFWTFIAYGLHFFPRTLLTASAQQLNSLDTGSFWIAVQYSIVLFMVILAIAIAVVVGYDMFAILRRARDTDGLTGLLNRRGLERAVERLPTGREASVIIADLDDFKRINDTLGHAAGDTVLRAIARRLVQIGREGDVVARIGGEEFMFLTPGSAADALQLAERARAAIASAPVDIDGTPLKVTATFGVARYAPGDDFWDAVRNADRALYSAKRSSKNSVAAEAQ